MKGQSLSVNVANALRHIKNAVKTSVANSVLRAQARRRLRPETPLVIVDEQLPYVLSPFREIEYRNILLQFNGSILATFRADGLGDSNERARAIRNLALREPLLPRRLVSFDPQVPFASKMAYVVFLDSAYRFVKRWPHVPFVFTLYPGGGFNLYDRESDQKLSEVIRSETFRGVLATQPVTLRYLQKKGVPDQKIFYSYGVLIDLPGAKPSRRWRAGETAIRIVFCAFKYTRWGRDKGLDLFVGAVEKLLERGISFEAHVVGNFGPGDCENKSHALRRIKWHGVLAGVQLEDLLTESHIVVSPNRPDVLAPGAFDGFPTASVMQAGMNGMLMMCTDPLNQGEGILLDGLHYVRIEPDAEHIAIRIEEIASNPERAAMISEAGSMRLRELLKPELQMSRRTEMITQAQGTPNRGLA